MQAQEELIQAFHQELAFDFVRASGPGGQNVNKVATSAQLRFDTEVSQRMPEEVKRRLRRLAGRRMTSDGILVIEAKRHRTREQNRADAIARFDALIRKAFETPPRRVATKATAAAIRRRLEQKRQRGKIKRARQGFAEE